MKTHRRRARSRHNKHRRRSIKKGKHGRSSHRKSKGQQRIKKLNARRQTKKDRMKNKELKK